jgi:alkylation response protein AidB-like acyl-CoA dehydrogenase
MSYGDGGGALGYLVGQPHRGLEYMFIMMNAARLSVGVQGIGLSELALQQASEWAHSRVQGRAVGPRRCGLADHAAPGRGAHAADDTRERRGHARAGAVYGAVVRSCARGHRSRNGARPRLRVGNC